MMESDERNQNLDSNKEKDMKTNQNPDSDHNAEESKAPESAADSKPVVVGEQKPKGNRPFKLPIKVIVPAIVVIAAVILVSIFLIHPANKTIAAVSYTPVNYISNSGIDSIAGGNWSLVNNETVNSTVLNEYAGTGYFPPGTVAAVLQEFAPTSEIPAIAANKTANVSFFETNIYYLNSSSEATSLFSEINSEVGSQYVNDSKIKYNTTSIGNSSMLYINGELNSSNSSLENVTELYLINSKSFVVAAMSNGNLDYSQAKSIVNLLFS
jgi:hypothetical protein